MTALRAKNSHRALMLTAAFALVAISGLAEARSAQAAPASTAKTVTAAAYDPDVANSPFPNLAVSVSQTTDLIQQGINVSWTGGKQSTVPNQQAAGSNFLQVMQCWGDEAGSNGTRPDRTTCQYGGLALPGDSRNSVRDTMDDVSPEDLPYTDPGDGFANPALTSIPFTSATGKTIALIVDGKRTSAPDPNNNEFFNKFTTNEVSWGGSGADGKGSISFELQTVQQSPGLGCGAAKTAADGTVTGASCWLVIIPRGDGDPNSLFVVDSGLFQENWKHHVAIKLGFKPSGLRCAIGAAERQLSGSELAAEAVGRWQPTLCGSAGGAVFSLLTGAESDAALAANGTTTAPLALTSRALSTEGVTDHLAYAPVALTGISLTFAIDEQADVTKTVPQATLGRERQSFTSLKLTPRLLAKLLTASYTDALPPQAGWSHLSKIRNVTQDPEFLAINDSEWKYMRIVGAGVGDALVPLGRSDAARAVWNYIMADAAAAAFLNGEADNVRSGDSGNSGMHVNPYYSTNASVNPTGVGLTLPRDDFPKADPVEFKGTPNLGYSDTMNLVDWRPYVSSLDASAYSVLRGDPQKLGNWNISAVPNKYDKADRGLVGLQAVIGLTDTASASRYQTVQAALLNPAGKFVEPTTSSLAAAAAAMTAKSGQSQIVSFDATSTQAKAAPDAYPLTAPVYAAANPAMTDAEVRADYSLFITTAVTTGQTPGTDDGQLPDGYAPIPAAWKTQALAAAAIIKSGAWPSASSTPTATASASATTQTTTAAPTATNAAVQQTALGAGATNAPATDPAATGATAPALTSGKTGDDPSVGAMAAVVPVSAGAALIAALAIPPLTRRRRL